VETAGKNPFLAIRIRAFLAIDGSKNGGQKTLFAIRIRTFWAEGGSKNGRRKKKPRGPF
jgi:hypothetical protein